MVIHLPQKGARVGAYEIIEQLGQGGGGYVYKAERGGRYYAVKVLNTLDLDGWTRREVTALVNLPLPNVVRFVGYDRWPNAETGYPCIVMEFVSGLPLDLWALRNNPSTRQALTIFLKTTQALREVFRLGVLHRDIKESNIVIRAHDGEPILIDFGFSSVAGVPTVTGPGRLPPGTPEYRSPEAMRFLAGMTEEDSYTYSLSDELWSLGVTLYWLLTDVLPFGDRKEPGLNARIRLESPAHPCMVAPRLPEAASRLCLRMLEKDPRARFQTHDEICSAVEALLVEHEGDSSWDVPLIDPESPHEEEPHADKPRNEQEKQVQQWICDKPRRGRWREEEPPAAPALEKPPPVAIQEGQAQAPFDAPALDIAPAGQQVEAAAAPPPKGPAGLVADAAPPLVHGRAEARAPAEPARNRGSRLRLWRRGTVGPFPMGLLLLDLLKRPPLALVAALALGALAVGFVGAWHRPAPAREFTPAPLAVQAAPPPGASAGSGDTEGAAPLREVAQPGNPAEANRGAAPVRAQPPAPTPTAMLRKEDSRMRSEEKAAPQAQKKAQRCVPIRQRVCMAAGVCSIILTGCTGAQVRPESAPMECPVGWYETHTKFGIRGGDAVLPGYKGRVGEEPATLKEGPLTVRARDVGALPEGTLLMGTLVFGEKRFFGRFTQAQTPDRQTYPVCLQVERDAPTPSGCTVGVGDCPKAGSKPGAFKIFPTLPLRETNRFE